MQTEQKLTYLIEAYDYVQSLTTKSSAVQREVQEKLRLVDITKKKKKAEETKERERTERLRKKQVIIDKIQMSEQKQQSGQQTLRVQKLRSRKP